MFYSKNCSRFYYWTTIFLNNINTSNCQVIAQETFAKTSNVFLARPQLSYVLPTFTLIFPILSYIIVLSNNNNPPPQPIILISLCYLFIVCAMLVFNLLMVSYTFFYIALLYFTWLYFILLFSLAYFSLFFNFIRFFRFLLIIVHYNLASNLNLHFLIYFYIIFNSFCTFLFDLHIFFIQCSIFVRFSFHHQQLLVVLVTQFFQFKSEKPNTLLSGKSIFPLFHFIYWHKNLHWFFNCVCPKSTDKQLKSI